MGRPKILLVEDEPDLAYILSSSFKNAGFELRIARSAESGLNVFPKYQPALVITDVMLPGMNGLEMVRKLRRTSQVPVLFLTARKDEEMRTLGCEARGDDYMRKPFSIRDLISRVKAILLRSVPEPARRQKAATRNN